MICYSMPLDAADSTTVGLAPAVDTEPLASSMQAAHLHLSGTPPLQHQPRTRHTAGHEISMAVPFVRGLPNLPGANLCFQNALLTALLSMDSVACLLLHATTVTRYDAWPYDLSATGTPVLQCLAAIHAWLADGSQLASLHLQARLSAAAAGHSEPVRLCASQSSAACGDLSVALRLSMTLSQCVRGWSHFGQGNQEDLYEFFVLLRSAIDQELALQLLPSAPSATDHDAHASLPLAFQPSSAFIQLQPMVQLADLFSLWMTETTWCENPHCDPPAQKVRNLRRRSMQQELIVRVPPPAGDDVPLASLLDAVFAKCSMEPQAVPSPNDCCARRDLQFTRANITAPDDWPLILCVVLSRHHDATGSLHHTRVDCPLELDASSWQGPPYTLHATCNHVGSSSSQGHFMSFVRGQRSWTCYDDSVVSTLPAVESHRIITAGTYLLFYVRTPETTSHLHEQPAMEPQHQPELLQPDSPMQEPVRTREWSACSAPVTPAHDRVQPWRTRREAILRAHSKPTRARTLLRRMRRTGAAIKANQLAAAQTPDHEKPGPVRSLTSPPARPSGGHDASPHKMRMAAASPRKLAGQYLQLRTRQNHSRLHLARQLNFGTAPSVTHRSDAVVSTATDRLEQVMSTQPGLHQWALQTLQPNLPHLPSCGTPVVTNGPPSPSKPRDRAISSFTTRIGAKQQLLQALRMTAWHSQWQGLFPAWASETEVAGNRLQRRTDTSCRGWRCEFETLLPSKAKVETREALIGPSLVWILNMTAPAFRRKLSPVSPCEHDASVAPIGTASLPSDARCVHQIRSLVLHPGLQHMKKRLFIDLGFSDCLLRVDTPLPLPLRPHGPMRKQATRLPPQAQTIASIWSVQCVSWHSFLEQHGDLQYYRTTWDDGKQSFLSYRPSADTCHRWLLQGWDEPLRAPQSSGPTSFLSTLEHAPSQDRVKGDSLSSTVHQLLEQVQGVPKHTLIIPTTKLLLSAPKASVLSFNHKLQLALEDGQPFLSAMLQAMRQAFGDPASTRPPLLKYRRDHLRIQLLKAQAQLLDQALRMHALQRAWLSAKSAQWRSLILRHHPHLAMPPGVSGAASQDSSCTSRMPVAAVRAALHTVEPAVEHHNRQHGGQLYLWQKSVRNVYYSIAQELQALSEHSSRADRSKQNARINLLFTTRMGYVIQTIFNPRDGGPSLPPLQAQVDYFRQRFKCEYFQPAAHPVPGDTAQGALQRCASNAATEVMEHSSDDGQAMPDGDPRPHLGRTTPVSCMQTDVWLPAHTRKRSFARFSCPPGLESRMSWQALRCPPTMELTVASTQVPAPAGHTGKPGASDPLQRQRYPRAARDATIGVYNHHEQEQAVHQIMLSWTGVTAAPRKRRSTRHASGGAHKPATDDLFESDWRSESGQSDNDRERAGQAASHASPATAPLGLASVPQLQKDDVYDVAALPSPLSEPNRAPWAAPAADTLHTVRRIFNRKDPRLHFQPLGRNLLTSAWQRLTGLGADQPAPQRVRPGPGKHPHPLCSRNICALDNHFTGAHQLSFQGAPRLPPQTAILVTDGSCKDSIGGYAAILLVRPEDAICSPCAAESCCVCRIPAPCQPQADTTPKHTDRAAFNITLLCGGQFDTTSGSMELLAAYRGTHYVHAHLKAIRHLFLLTDYLSLVQCQWSYQHLLDWKTQKNSYLWERLYALFTHFQSVHLTHVKAHDENSQAEWAWKTHMNEQADTLANAGRQAVADQRLIPSSIPNEVLAPHQQWTDGHARALFLAPITEVEMQAALRSININSSPGPDGVPIKIFRLFDAVSLSSLHREFERVRAQGSVPEQWKESRITLIYKKGEAAEVANWRPITVQKAITLLFTKIFARRLLRALWQLRVMSMSQKCNVQNIAGVSEHCFMLRAILEDMRTKARLGIDATCIIVFTDVAKAFDSIQRGTLLDVLRGLLGDVQPFIKLIGSLYEDVSIILSDADGQAATVPKQAGIHQGDALSAIFYIMVNEYARRMYENDTSCSQRRGYVFLGDTQAAFPCTKMNYEDDEQQCFSSVSEARRTLDQLTQALRSVYLTLNPSKCTVLALRTVATSSGAFGAPQVSQSMGAIDTPQLPQSTAKTTRSRSRQLQAFDPGLEIDGVRLRVLHIDEPFTSLGLTLTGSNDMSHGQAAAISIFFKALTQLDQSTLDVGKKLYLMRTVVHAKIEHHFRNMYFSAEALENLDRLQRSIVRKWLQADTFKLNDAFMQASCDDGGLGLSSLRDRWELLYLSNFAHMVCAHDPALRNAAWSMVHTSQIGRVWPPCRAERSSRYVTSKPRDRLLTEHTYQQAEERARPAFFGWTRLPAEEQATPQMPSSTQPAPTSFHSTQPPGESSSPQRAMRRTNLHGASAHASMAVQYARLAHKLNVGFYVPHLFLVANDATASHAACAAGSGSQRSSPEPAMRQRSPTSPLQQLILSLDGAAVDGPFALTSLLMDKLRHKYKDELAKQRIVEGYIERHQGLSHLPVATTIPFTRLFLSAQCDRYTDQEVSIILKAQLDLWPTAVKLSLLKSPSHAAAGAIPPSVMCRYCRSQRETVSHLLTISQNLDTDAASAQRHLNRSPAFAADLRARLAHAAHRPNHELQPAPESHPAELASLATTRHDLIVRTIGKFLHQEVESYLFIAAEREVLRDHWPVPGLTRPASQQWTAKASGWQSRIMHPPAGVHHNRPDIILVCQRAAQPGSVRACEPTTPPMSANAEPACPAAQPPLGPTAPPRHANESAEIGSRIHCFLIDALATNTRSRSRLSVLKCWQSFATGSTTTATSSARTACSMPLNSKLRSTSALPLPRHGAAPTARPHPNSTSIKLTRNTSSPSWDAAVRSSRLYSALAASCLWPHSTPSTSWSAQSSRPKPLSPSDCSTPSCITSSGASCSSIPPGRAVRLRGDDSGTRTTHAAPVCVRSMIVHVCMCASIRS